MLNRLPKCTPSFSDLLTDIGNPSDQAIAKALNVTARTVHTWRKTEAPRPVLLALFWITRWGLSATNAEVLDLSDMHYATTLMQRLEIKRLQSTIEQLQRIGHFGSANDPHRLTNTIHPPSPRLEPGQPAQVAPVASLCVTPRAIGLT